MEKVKLAVIYYSMTGINYQLAQWAAEAAKEAGAEVRLLKVHELAPEIAINNNPLWKANVEATKEIPEASSNDLDWADAIIFSVPTRFGNLAAQMKQFIDLQGGLWAQGKLMNKVVSGMSSAQNPHGGQEVTIKSLYTSLMHWGAIIVPPGYTDPSIFKAGGNPYGTSVTQGQDGKMVEDVKEAVFHQAKRTIEIAGWLNKGKE
ncbi:NAD(P)H:quinone oxidoreductase, type IV [Desulfosporosinus acidiphilus SJ4]|uniref:NAD(P)H:quinone oxidoreductase, type IV n=1 Tax=Desulfosporosinus acidiphilus (strain DSM 22704 / JCM 16185 / SJ4) TaxID=646529 RepID=I4D1N1_DESAJ|nr:NAD(P)H:quinone oxidoreductase [Desulfosporosinus acidiphilus]AFM39705.1 NAD(P)H:quinone oxidoreductase, type IV [Desulfosporosinus acidiphilus SJ4]